MQYTRYRAKPVNYKHLDEEFYNDMQEHLDKNNWLYGYLLKKEDSDEPVIVGDVIDISNDYCNIQFWASADPETVCRGTGVKDKNGKEIFEGDILKIGVRDGIYEDFTYLKVYFDYRVSYQFRLDAISTGYFGNSALTRSLSRHTLIVGNTIDAPYLWQKIRDKWRALG